MRLSEMPPGEVDESLEDIGDHLEVPEDERLDHDDQLPGETNEDEFADLSDVPEGDPDVELDGAPAEEYDDEER